MDCFQTAGWAEVGTKGNWGELAKASRSCGPGNKEEHYAAMLGPDAHPHIHIPTERNAA